jgi:hypothetical protein
MNTRFLKIAGLLGVFTLAAIAQTSVAKVSVPFEFAASGAMLPAGEYTLEAPDLSGVLLLHGSAGNSVALLTTFSAAVPNTSNAKFIFERRNGVAYLASVEWPNQSANVISVFKHVTKGAVAAKLR